MQIINIRIENEEGKIIKQIEINFADVMNFLYEVEEYKDKYPWLASIDPYGNTVFNPLQIPNVIREIQELREYITQTEQYDKYFKKITDFFEEVVQGYYLKFIGD